MDEEAIAERLKQNIPKVVEPTLVPQAPPDTTNGQATTADTYDLDEMTQYKLHDLFGVQYKPNDEVSNQQVSYIYQEVAKRVPEPEYGFVVAKIRELERMIGTSNDGNRIYRLYQWLKLDTVRRETEAQMGVLSNG